MGRAVALSNATPAQHESRNAPRNSPQRDALGRFHNLMNIYRSFLIS
jgi:hypothetical protein